MLDTDYRLPLTTENGIIFSTVGIRQSPLISKCWKSVFFYFRKRSKYRPWTKISRSYDFKCRRLFRRIDNGLFFKTMGKGLPQFNIEMLKTQFFHYTHSPNIDREPKFKDPTTHFFKMFTPHYTHFSYFAPISWYHTFSIS